MMFDTRKGVSAPWLMLEYTGRREIKKKKIQNIFMYTKQASTASLPRITRGSSLFFLPCLCCPSIDANGPATRKKTFVEKF